MPLPSDAIAVSQLPSDAIALDQPPKRSIKSVLDQWGAQGPNPGGSVMLDPVSKNLTGTSVTDLLNQKYGESLMTKVAGFIPDQLQTPGNYGLEPFIKGAGELGMDALRGVGKSGSYLSKSSANYVTDTVAPKAYKLYQDSINKFTPQIQKFSEEKLNIPKSAIETIKSHGVQAIDATRKALGDTTDTIVQRLNEQVGEFRKAADIAYGKAIESAPEGKSINIKSAIDEAGKSLKKLGLITEKGNLTELGQSEIARDSTYSKLLDFFKSGDSISGVEAIKAKGAAGDLTINQGSKLFQARDKTLVNKEQYQFLRDKLNALYKGKSSDVSVAKVADSFYNAGEQSGMQGLGEARKLQRNAFDLEENYLKHIKEKSFDRFHTLPEAQKRSLQELETKLGVPFVEELKALSAGKYLDKLKEINPQTFKTDLVQGVDPKWTQTIQDKYSDILGSKTTKDIINELISHRKGIKIKTAGKWVGGIGASVVGGNLGVGAFHKITGH